MKPSPKGRRPERSTADTRRRANERPSDRATRRERARVPSFPRSSRHGDVGARMTSRTLDATVPGGSRRGRRRVRASTTRRGAEKIVGREIQRAQDPLGRSLTNRCPLTGAWREDVDGSSVRGGVGGPAGSSRAMNGTPSCLD